MVTGEPDKPMLCPQAHGNGVGTVMEGQRLSHAGSHRVAWGKTHTVPALPKPPARAMGKVTKKQPSERRGPGG